jgi:hypothetical protein
MAASGADLLGAVWGLGVRAKRFRDAQQAIGELIAEALASAICPDSPNDAAAVTAALAVRRELRKTPVPIATGREQGRASRLGDKLAVGLRIRGVPTVARFGESDFYRLLSDWLREALRSPDESTLAALSRVGCRDVKFHADLSPDVLAVYFVAGFAVSLHGQKGSEWKTKLLSSLEAADRSRQWQKDQVPWLRLVLGDTALAGLTFLAAHLAGAADYQSLIAAFAALGISVPTELQQAWKRRPVSRSPVQEELRAAVALWLADCGQALLGQTSKRQAPPALVWIKQLRETRRPPCPPPALIDHLSRLSDLATAGEEQGFAAELLAVENAFRRGAYTPAAQDDALSALEALAKTLGP